MPTLDKLEGRRVVASVSGGKDSAAMCLWLTEEGIEHDRVFADTGWAAASDTPASLLPGRDGASRGAGDDATHAVAQ